MKKQTGLLLLIFLPFLFTAKLLFLQDPPVWPDEALFFDMAKHLLSFGTLKASLYSGTNPIAVNTGYGYPPLYFAFLGVWTFLFGGSIEAVRFLSLVLGIFSLFVFFLILKQLFKSPLVWYLGTAILSFDITFSRAGRVGRMEILVLLFFLLSVYFFLLWQKQRKFFYLPLIGILSGLTMLTHPIGVIAPILLLSYIALGRSNSKIKEFLTIVAFSLVILSVWLIPLKGDFLALLTTFQLHWQNKSQIQPYYFFTYTSDLSWFFLINISLIIILTAVFLLFANKSLKRLRLTIVLGIIISLFIAITNRMSTYMVIVEPFVILCIAVLLEAAIQVRSKALRISIFGLVILFVLANINIQFFNDANFNLNTSGNRSYIEASSSDYHQLTGLVGSTLLLQKALYYPNRSIKIYLSVTPDPYFDLKEFPQFVFFEAIAPLFPVTPKEYKALLDNCDYIVYNWIPNQFLDDYIKNNTLERVVVSQSYGYFVVISRLLPKEIRK